MNRVITWLFVAAFALLGVAAPLGLLALGLHP